MGPKIIDRIENTHEMLTEVCRPPKNLVNISLIRIFGRLATIFYAILVFLAIFGPKMKAGWPENYRYDIKCI